MDTTHVLVTGATGTVGRQVVEAVRARGMQPRPGSRSANPPLDLTDPATWKGAFDGVDALFLVLPEGVHLDPRLVECAHRRVEHIVLLSSRGIEEMNDQRLLDAERLVKECACPHTIVRADWFNQNFSEGFFADSVLAGHIVMPVGGMRQAFVDTQDIGEVAAALMDPSAPAHGDTVDITGPEALSFDDVCRVLGDVIGRPVTFDGTADGYRTMMTGFGVPREQVEGEIDAFQALAQAGDATVTSTVSDLTGRPATAFSEFARMAAASGAWRT